jgi:hypothetical protein
MTAKTTSTTHRSFGANNSRRPPTWNPRMLNAGGYERGVPPKIIPARPCSSTSRPNVTTTASRGCRPSTGRIRASSTTAPSTRPDSTATSNASQYEPPCWMTV